MKVKKFGGTSVGSADRIRNVGRLISGAGRNIVVLSAMSGTTNALLEISGALADGDRNLAKQRISDLEEKYRDVTASLFDTEKYRNEASELVGGIFSCLRGLADEEYSIKLEKRIVSYGELISTNLMNFHLHEIGVDSCLLPALEFMKTDRHGEPDMEYAAKKLALLMGPEPDADL